MQLSDSLSRSHTQSGLRWIVSWSNKRWIKTYKASAGRMHLLPPLLRRRARTRPRGLPSPAWELPGPPACAAADSAAVSAAPIEDTPDEGLLAGSEEPAVPAGAAPPGAASVPNPVVAAGVPDAVGAEGAPSAGASSDCISSPSMSMPVSRIRTVLSTHAPHLSLLLYNSLKGRSCFMRPCVAGKYEHLRKEPLTTCRTCNVCNPVKIFFQ